MPSIEQLVQSIDGESRRPERRRSSRRRATRREPRRKVAGREASRKPRSGQPLLPETAGRLLAGSDGLSTAVLAEQTGASRDQVLSLLRQVGAARRVRRTGHRRGTRWHAITHENRIQERAAELATRSRRPTRSSGSPDSGTPGLGR